MTSEIGSRVRYGEAFWRAHHEAWQQSALNQREYCSRRFERTLGICELQPLNTFVEQRQDVRRRRNR